MGVVMETEVPPAESPAMPMPDTDPPEPNEADLPDKPPVPDVPDGPVEGPGDEPVPEKDFQSPEEAEGDPETDSTEQDRQARYDGGAIPK